MKKAIQKKHRSTNRKPSPATKTLATHGQKKAPSKKKSKKSSGTSETEESVASPFVIRTTIAVVDSPATGEAIRALRELHGISARKVAMKVGYSSMSVSLHERGKRKITPSAARKIVTAIFALAKKPLPKNFELKQA